MLPLILLGISIGLVAGYCVVGLLFARLMYYRFPRVFYSMSDDRDIALIAHMFMWPIVALIELISAAVVVFWRVSDGRIEKLIDWFMGWKKRD